MESALSWLSSPRLSLRPTKKLARKTVLIALVNHMSKAPEGSGPHFATWHDHDLGDYLVCATNREYAPKCMAVEMDVDVDGYVKSLWPGNGEPTQEFTDGILQDLAQWSKEWNDGDIVDSPSKLAAEARAARLAAKQTSSNGSKTLKFDPNRKRKVGAKAKSVKAKPKTRARRSKKFDATEGLAYPKKRRKTSR